MRAVLASFILQVESVFDISRLAAIVAACEDAMLLNEIMEQAHGHFARIESKEGRQAWRS